MKQTINKRRDAGEDRLNIFFGGLEGLSSSEKAKAKVVVLAIMSKYYDKIASATGAGKY